MDMMDPRVSGDAAVHPGTGWVGMQGVGTSGRSKCVIGQKIAWNKDLRRRRYHEFPFSGNPAALLR
jgi:hypothetical protein